MNTADNVEELALQIYNNHRDAIDLIINARPAAEAKGWDLLDSTVECFLPLLQPDFHSKWYHRFFAPGLEDVPELKQGSGWTESGRLLLFELRYKSREIQSDRWARSGGNAAASVPPGTKGRRSAGRGHEEGQQLEQILSHCLQQAAACTRRKRPARLRQRQNPG